MELNGEFLFHQDNLPSASFVVFTEMKQQGKLCDITIKFENHSISAHRLVLAAAIPYFRDAFSTQEKGSEVKEVIMKEIDPHALEALIDSAYSCKVEITGGNVNSLLHASCALNMEELREACCDFIGKRLETGNVLTVREMAEKLGCWSLVERSNSYIYDNFDEVSQTDEFLNAPFHFIKQLLVSEDLKTTREDNVFQSVIKWVNKFPDDRKDGLPELLSNVRLTLLTPDYLVDHVMTEPHIRNSIQCRDILDKAKFYHLLPHRNLEFSSFEARPRPCPRIYHRSTVSGIYAIRKEMRYKVQHLDSEKGRWRTIDTKPFMDDGSVAACNENLYFIDYGYLGMFSPVNNKWVIPSGCYFPTRINPGVAVINKKLYICGGQDKQFFLNTVDVFDLEVLTVSEAASMKIFRSRLEAVALGDYIYAIGGMTEECVHDSVERYDSRYNKWEMMSPMNVKRYSMGCATMDGKIYVCGGVSSNEEDLSSAEVYDPLINEWKCISPMSTARYNFSVVAYRGKLHAVGGYSDHIYLNTTEVYDPRTDEWKFGTSMDPSLTDVKAISFPSVNDSFL